MKYVFLAIWPCFVFYLLFDAIQIVTASALRGFEQTLLPSLIYLFSQCFTRGCDSPAWSAAC